MIVLLVVIVNLSPSSWFLAIWSFGVNSEKNCSKYIISTAASFAARIGAYMEEKDDGGGSTGLEGHGWERLPCLPSFLSLSLFSLSLSLSPCFFLPRRLRFHLSLLQIGGEEKQRRAKRWDAAAQVDADRPHYFLVDSNVRHRSYRRRRPRGSTRGPSPFRHRPRLLQATPGIFFSLASSVSFPAVPCLLYRSFFFDCSFLFTFETSRCEIFRGFSGWFRFCAHYWVTHEKKN